MKTGWNFPVVLAVSCTYMGACYQMMLTSADCKAGMEKFIQVLKSKGFDIPDDFGHHPDRGFEGGSNWNEFQYFEGVAAGLTSVRKRVNICQTGFNYGTSAFAFLCGSDARVYSYDIGDYPYVSAANKLIEAVFPGRHNLILGDSTATLRDAAKTSAGLCDLVLVDGGHTHDIVLADLRNFRVLSKPGTTVIVDDCDLTQSQKINMEIQHLPEVTSAFRKMIAHGTEDVANTIYFHGSFHGRSVCVGKYSKL